MPSSTDPERSQPISYGARLEQLAAAHPDEVALVYARVADHEHSVTWQELNEASNHLANTMISRGVNDNTTIVVELPNSPEHFASVLAAWKVGSLVIPIRPDLPPPERLRLLELAEPTMVISKESGIPYPTMPALGLFPAESTSSDPLPIRVSHPGKGMVSGGSTGFPKIIVDPNRWERDPSDVDGFQWFGFKPHQRQLVVGPLYHNVPFSWGHFGLFYDQTVFLADRFDANHVVDLIELRRINWLALDPTMMQRIIRLPGLSSRNLSSVETVFHSGAPCAPWLKNAWIELLGASKIYESFSSTESIGRTGIWGDEWLKHPGSVGKPIGCDVCILDDAEQELPSGEIGEVFMRPIPSDTPTHYYIGGQTAKKTSNGFISVGDLGWRDRDGYLFVADRRVDLIITGGVNVYPAEVESVLLEHPEVGDVAVVGVPNEEVGKQVHAIVQPRDPSSPPDDATLQTYVSQYLVSDKVPTSYQLVSQLPRDASGKLNRSKLLEKIIRQTSSH